MFQFTLPPVEKGPRDKSLLVEFVCFLKQGMCYSEKYKKDFEKMESAKEWDRDDLGWGQEELAVY